MVDVDLVVAGAGAAGTAAALAAAERGASVVLLELDPHFRQGNNTSMSTSMIPAGGSRWQEAAGIEDSPERFRADIERKTKGTVDPVLADALTTVAPELVAWLADRTGMPLGLVTDFRYPGHSTDRCHAVPDRAGSTMHGYLLAAVEATDDIDLIVPMGLESVSEVADGTVEVRVAAPGEDTETIHAGAVVLATNGFGADAARVRELIPEIADGVYHGGEFSRGDALRIGRDLSADTSHLDAYQGHGSVAVPQRTLLTWAAIMHGGVMVDRSGTRFGDETVGYSEFGAAVAARPGATAWVIFDDRIHDLLMPFKDYTDLLSNGGVREVADRDALADVIGAPRDRLDDTLDEVVGLAGTQTPDRFGRVHPGPALSEAFRVVRVAGALFHTQGGLKVDGLGRVLRDGTPVPGVHAAGGAAQGISGHGADGYLAGNGLLGALGLGYLSGRAVTARA